MSTENKSLIALYWAFLADPADSRNLMAFAEACYRAGAQAMQEKCLAEANSPADWKAITDTIREIKPEDV